MALIAGTVQSGLHRRGFEGPKHSAWVLVSTTWVATTLLPWSEWLELTPLSLT